MHLFLGALRFKLLTEYHLEFLSLEGGCTGLSESTLVKMSHCWKSHVTAHIILSVPDVPIDTYVMTLSAVDPDQDAKLEFYIIDATSAITPDGAPVDKNVYDYTVRTFSV